MARPARKMGLPTFIGILLALAWLFSGPALSAAPDSRYASFTATGSVIANHDGDTFKLQTQDHGILTIRFSGMDTPETGQAFWKSARRELARLVSGQPITVACYKREWHGRDVCKVFTGKVLTEKTDVGLDMVRRGMAWYAFQYAAELTTAEQLAYRSAEEKARLARVGLWAEPDPMAPWECRKIRRAGLGQKCR